MNRVSVLIPAYNEAERIAATVEAVRGIGPGWEIIVIDDGSRDATAERAAATGAVVKRLPQNRGKGAALEEGLALAGGDVILLLDADLGPSAVEAEKLLGPLERDEADMVVARFPKRGPGGGLGLVKALAAFGLRRFGGRFEAPLSGQRALKKEVLAQALPLGHGFGVEVGLSIDALRRGYRILEVETTMAHRATGRDFAGFRHRARQFVDVFRTLVRKSWS